MIDFTRRKTTLALGALAAAPLSAGCSDRTRTGLLAFSGATMAGAYTVKIARPGTVSAAGTRALEQAIFAAVDAVDRAMSTFRSDSELSALNRHAAGTPFGLSPELTEVLVKAREVSIGSGGAFDVTIGGLVNAWGFGPAGRGAPPAREQLARLRDRVSWRSLEIDARTGAVVKLHPDAQTDLSGIAQGHGADRIAATLEAHGFGDYMVEVCGEVRARGTNAEGLAWRIGIERPVGGAQRTLQYVVPLANRSLATSGDYRNFFEHDGRRYSHEIDPATGEPVAHRLGSVTVVQADCALADAWATALFVLGPERGLALALERGLAAYFVVRETGGTLVDVPTPAFVALGGRSVADA